MVCPSYWANKLFWIERNSRCLNRATWNISNLFIQSAPKWKRRGEERGKKIWLTCHYLVKVKFIFICNQLNYSCIPCWAKERWCLRLEHRFGRHQINVLYVAKFFLSAWKIHCFNIHGDDTMWLLFVCRILSVIEATWCCLSRWMFRHENQYS